MKSAFMRLICRLLIVSMAALPLQTVQAGMIGADQVAAVASAQTDRAAVLSLINRADVAQQLQSLGLDPRTAADRVTAMTDDEVRSLAGKINSLPAGAWSGWTVAVLILIIIVIWYRWR